MNTNQVKCQNCEKLYDEGFQFCPHCGQKAHEELTLGVLFYNTICNYFSFDARFLKSVFPLLLRPGYLAKQFIKGKRLWYLHPAQMYLFFSVVFFFIFSFYIRDSRQKLDDEMQRVIASRNEKRDGMDKTKDSLALDSLQFENVMKPLKDNQAALGIDDRDMAVIDSLSHMKVPRENIGSSFTLNGKEINEKTIDSLIASGTSDEEIYKYMGLEDDAGFFKRKFYSQMLKFYKEMGLGQIYQTFIDSIPIAMFFLLPILALLLKLFFFKKGRYVHHLVFAFYYFSFLFLVLSIIFGINLFWDIPDWIDSIIAMSTFFYFLIAIINFYKQNWFLSILKTGTVSFLFFIVLSVSAGVLGVLSFMLY